MQAARRAARAIFAPTRLLGLVALGLLLALRIWDPVPVEFLRLQSFDQYQRWSPRPQTAQRVVVVDIDDSSLAEIGQWPWPRTIVADLVIKLFRARAVAVAFDIVFAEPDRMSPARFAESAVGLKPRTVEDLRGLPSNDQIFANVLRQTRVVLGQAASDEPPEDNPSKPRKRTSIIRLGGDPRPYLLSWSTAIPNLPELEDAATGRGMFVVRPDKDNIMRRVPAVLQVGDKIYPSLSIELLRVATRQQSLTIKTNPAGIESVFVKPFWIPTDRKGRIWVRYARYDPARYVSAKDVIAGDVAPHAIAGKLVLIGTSAPGLYDIRATPLEGGVPGVEVHLQLLEAIMTQAYLIRPKGTALIEMLVILGAGLLLIVLVPILGALWTMGLYVALTGTLAGASWYMFLEHGVLLDAAYPAAATLFVYGLLSFINYTREEAQRRQIRTAFGQYLSPEMVDRLAQNPEMLKLGGENRDMTLLFCDVVGFTAISEKYDAESLTRLINRLLTPLTDTILRAHGTIDKYMGDCIMAFWNAPMENKDHARDGCRAALAMFRRLAELNAEMREEADQQGNDFTPLKVGIGLNTGVVCVGNMGSEQRFDYSVIGDDVNLASRLEGQTRLYHVRIVIGEKTYARVDGMAALELDLIRVKGKTVPVRIYALLGDEETAHGAQFAALRETHEAMLSAYRAQDWDAARAALEQSRANADGFDLDELYRTFAERIDDFQADPPGEDWDGVYVATTK